MKERIRGSDVYVQEDIVRILRALVQAGMRYGGDYGRGYLDALRDMAAAVGVDGAPGDIDERGQLR